MSSPALTLLGVTLVLAGLIGILVVVVLRLRGADGGAARTHVSEEAFMATAIQEGMAARAPVAAPTAQPRPTSGRHGHRVGAAGSAYRGAAGRHRVADQPRGPPAARTSRPHRRCRRGAASSGSAPALLEAIEQAISSKSAVASRLEIQARRRHRTALALCVWPMQPEPGTPASCSCLLTDLTDAERGTTLERSANRWRDVGAASRRAWRTSSPTASPAFTATRG